MNISFYLIPKIDVAYLDAGQTTEQALLLMEEKGYQAVPVVDQYGRYVGTLSEGDFLWTLVNQYAGDVHAMGRKMIGDYHPRREYKAVSIDADMETLENCIMNQNFVPVVDGRNVFIGIVTRQSIIRQLIRQNAERE